MVKRWAEQMCLEGTTEGCRVGVDGTDGGVETVPYVGAGHWEGAQCRPGMSSALYYKRNFTQEGQQTNNNNA